MTFAYLSLGPTRTRTSNHETRLMSVSSNPSSTYIWINNFPYDYCCLKRPNGQRGGDGLPICNITLLYFCSSPNLLRGSITVQLISSLTGLDYRKKENMLVPICMFYLMNI